MYELVLIRCRLAIQIGVGFFRDGRARHRTIWLRDVRPDAGADEIAAVVRALAPLLEGPVTRVRLVRKYALVLKTALNPISSQPVAFSSSYLQSNVHNLRRVEVIPQSALPPAPFRKGAEALRCGLICFYLSWLF